MDRRIWLTVGDDRRVLTHEFCARAWSDDYLAETRDAVDYLQRLIGNAVMMARLRMMLNDIDNTRLLDRRSDRQIVDEIAHRIRDKRMCLERYGLLPLPWPLPQASPAAPAREPAPEHRAPLSAPLPSPFAPALQEQIIDQDAQADTLERAAQNDVPFCERCA